MWTVMFVSREFIVKALGFASENEVDEKYGYNGLEKAVADMWGGSILGRSFYHEDSKATEIYVAREDQDGH